MIERICPTCLAYMRLDKLIGWLRCPACGFCKKEEKSMISLNELMGDNKYEDLPDELKKNAEELLRKVNLFRKEYGQPMYVTSGYRTLEHNISIGGAKDSAHCHCQAIDFKDVDGKLKEFIEKDTSILERYGLYQENPERTKTWIHLQSREIPSGNRIFNP